MNKCFDHIVRFYNNETGLHGIVGYYETKEIATVILRKVRGLSKDLKLPINYTYEKIEKRPKLKHEKLMEVDFCDTRD